MRSEWSRYEVISEGGMTAEGLALKGALGTCSRVRSQLPSRPQHSRPHCLPASALTVCSTPSGNRTPVTQKFDYVTPLPKTLWWLLIHFNTKDRVFLRANQNPARAGFPSPACPHSNYHLPFSAPQPHWPPHCPSHTARNAPAPEPFPFVVLLCGRLLAQVAPCPPPALPALLCSKGHY